MNFLEGYTNFIYEASQDSLRSQGFLTMIGYDNLKYGNEIDLDGISLLRVSSLVCFNEINDFAYSLAKMHNLPIKLIKTDFYPKALVKLRDSN